jgi:hypothetical protein
MNLEHFKAPWVADLGNLPGYDFPILAQGHVIAVVLDASELRIHTPEYVEAFNTRARATALLVAAAPELFEVVKFMLEFYANPNPEEFLLSYDAKTKALIAMGEKAIKKARG